MTKKLISIIFSFALMIGVLSACDKNQAGAGNQAEIKNEMQYVSANDLKEDITSGNNDYIILDARKEEDFNTSHIAGSFLADQDSAKEGNEEEGISNLKSALKNSTGNELGDNDKKYAIICYSGKSYAQKATDLLIKIGVPAKDIYTLEGGKTAWDEAGDEYKALLSE